MTTAPGNADQRPSRIGRRIGGVACERSLRHRGELCSPSLYGSGRSRPALARPLIADTSRRFIAGDLVERNARETGPAARPVRFRIRPLGWTYSASTRMVDPIVGWPVEGPSTPCHTGSGPTPALKEGNGPPPRGEGKHCYADSPDARGGGVRTATSSRSRELSRRRPESSRCPGKFDSVERVVDPLLLAFDAPGVDLGNVR